MIELVALPEVVVGGVVMLEIRDLTVESLFGVVESPFVRGTLTEAVFEVDDWGSSGEDEDFLGNVLPRDELRAETSFTPLEGVFSRVGMFIILFQDF